MMEFRTQYQPLKISTNVGSPVKIIYQGRYDKHGVLQIEESGKEDIPAYINSFKDSCDINVIVKRYANGDAAALTQRQGVFGDFADMPKTYAEMLNRILEGEQIFNSLPVDVRSLFNNSFTEFISTFGTEEWNEKMSVNKVSNKTDSNEAAVDNGE